MTDPAAVRKPLRVTEAAVLNAVAHPLRRRLLDVLRVHGPLTASLLAERTGSAVGNVSHHTRVLAEAGLIVEAPELARDRRERWWALVRAGIAWAEDDFEDDPASAAVAAAATQLGWARQVELTRAWLAAAPADPDWRRSAVSADFWMSLSSEELALMGDEVTALLGRWRTRARDDSVERRPVFVFIRGFPATP